jgi:hypothetical protein
MLKLMRRIRRVCPVLPPPSAFTGFRFPREVIVLAVRWYLRYGLSYRDVEELLIERGIAVGQPSRTDPLGDLDGVAALLEVQRGRLEIAESFAASSVRRWRGLSRLGNTRSNVTLATIHLRAGEADGVQMAHHAITAITTLSSVRARKRLEPLADALDARRGSDTRELARMAGGWPPRGCS